VRARCARCHGSDGLGRGEAFPRLAAQRRDYLRAALHAYAAAERQSGIMQPIAAELSDDEIDASADWYAGRPPPPPRARAQAPEGERIATRGIPERKIPACAHCHGPAREPRHSFYPILAAQYEWYLEQQLQLFMERDRGGSSYARLMDAVTAHALGPEERRAVARYYAGLAEEVRSAESEREPDGG
jgi:cytochrome c553